VQLSQGAEVMSSPVNTSSQERTVVCPSCKGPSIYSPRNLYRPFCSDRCKSIDLGAWANQEFAIPTPPTTEDLLDMADNAPPPLQ
jgi:endogenous inhibitor of DNA gyrase (YacG/DUF329 family)